MLYMWSNLKKQDFKKKDILFTSTHKPDKTHFLMMSSFFISICFCIHSLIVKPDFMSALPSFWIIPEIHTDSEMRIAIQGIQFFSHRSIQSSTIRCHRRILPGLRIQRPSSGKTRSFEGWYGSLFFLKFIQYRKRPSCSVTLPFQPPQEIIL